MSNAQDFLALLYPKPKFQNFLASIVGPPSSEKGSASSVKGSSSKADSHFDEVVPNATYCGISQLSYLSFLSGIDNGVPFYPKQGHPFQENTSVYVRPELPGTVETPTQEKKTEPIQDPVPRVKGIQAMFTELQKQCSMNSGVPITFFETDIDNKFGVHVPNKFRSLCSKSESKTI